jgi:hypothetical protein
VAELQVPGNATAPRTKLLLAPEWNRRTEARSWPRCERVDAPLCLDAQRAARVLPRWLFSHFPYGVFFPSFRQCHADHWDWPKASAT